MILICTDLYIPIWLYSNTWLRERNWKAWLLYIPIWLYSNSLKNYQDTFRIIFTFQSGYIQIRIDRIIGLTGTLLHSNLVIFKCTTCHLFAVTSSALHSNLVIFKLNPCQLWLLSSASLHSNMVIFKCMERCKRSCCKCTLHSNLVIFKYRRAFRNNYIYHLYIPIWLYSN